MLNLLGGSGRVTAPPAKVMNIRIYIRRSEREAVEFGVRNRVGHRILSILRVPINPDSGVAEGRREGSGSTPEHSSHKMKYICQEVL